MNHRLVDLAQFTDDSTFYGAISMLLTVKSFELQAIRKRYLESKKNKGNRRGSVERRAVAMGGLVFVTIENGQIVSEEVLAEMKEPRGIATFREMIAISAENEVYLIKNQEVRVIRNPWFSYIHTLDFTPDGQRLVVSSSGFDCLFEYDIASLECTWEWFAWENGFNQGLDPKTGEKVTLSRNAEDQEKSGFHVISDPAGQVLPTAMRAAFINSVVYDAENPEYLLATYFHEGAVYRIHMTTGKAEKVLDGLKTPHGGRRREGHFMATSTGSGEVVIGDRQGQTRYRFNGLEGKPEELEAAEWLQNSTVDGHQMITIDSNRTAFMKGNTAGILDGLRKALAQIQF